MIDPNGPGPDAPAAPDKPWLMRTYAGHSSARESNALFRRNLAKGERAQTGLSVAFDLPTQTGYDADHVLARGEVGRVGVPVGHLGDMRALFDGIPLERTNTSMTINATAMWLLALYQVVAEEQGADIARLTGTTQNDIIKEYLCWASGSPLGVTGGVVEVETRGYKQDGTLVCLFRRKVMVPTETYVKERGGAQPGRPEPGPDTS
jgi:methylmalonyl-CoA mutase cobalamin-binding domain/chain